MVWRELVLAGIGEQFTDYVSPFDDIVGMTVGIRDKEDIIQIWNLNHKYENEAKVCQKLKELVPNVNFSVIFYKGKIKSSKFDNINLMIKFKLSN